MLLFFVLLTSTGCETLHGAAVGLQQDVQNLANPDKNGWNAAKKIDVWMRENMW
jgi:hypothetical protein